LRETAQRARRDRAIIWRSVALERQWVEIG
jgi:hypothetical protein